MERPFDYCQDYTLCDSLNYTEFELELLNGKDFYEYDNLLYISDDEFKRSCSFLNDVEVIVNNSYILKEPSKYNSERKFKIKKTKTKTKSRKPLNKRPRLKTLKFKKQKKNKPLPKPTFLTPEEKQEKINNGERIYTCNRCGRNNFPNGHALGGHKKYCRKKEYYN
tara:strand:- start:187 stop:684 length:498 start_codon:yes stop_codon:yes gene_type:complete